MMCEQVVLDKQKVAEIAIPHDMTDESGNWEVLGAGNRVSAWSKRQALEVRQNPCLVGCECDRRGAQCVRPVAWKNERVLGKQTYWVGHNKLLHFHWGVFNPF